MDGTYNTPTLESHLVMCSTLAEQEGAVKHYIQEQYLSGNPLQLFGVNLQLDLV